MTIICSWADRETYRGVAERHLIRGRGSLGGYNKNPAKSSSLLQIPIESFLTQKEGLGDLFCFKQQNVNFENFESLQEQFQLFAPLKSSHNFKDDRHATHAIYLAKSSSALKRVRADFRGADPSIFAHV